MKPKHKKTGFRQYLRSGAYHSCQSSPTSIGISNRPSLRVAASLLRIIVFTIFGLSVANAGLLITFAPPAGGYVAKDGNYTATLQLTGSANPGTLQVTSGNLDVTYRFNPGSCSKAPCTLTALLTVNAGVLPGQNYLVARVNGANGSFEAARQRFNYQSGLGDPTTGYLPAHIVPIQQSSTTIKIMTPTPVELIPCPSPLVLIAVLNRSTLQKTSQTCDGDANSTTQTLKTLTQNDLIIISAPWGTGDIDFSLMGGSSTQQNKKGYYAVGFGAASPGTAYEAWQEDTDDDSHPKTIRGNLINLGCDSSFPLCKDPNTPLYVFQSTNAVAFAIVPGEAGSTGNPGLPTIYVGNPDNVLPGEGNAPPNQTQPQNSTTNQGLFSNATYSPTWTGQSAAGGIYLLTLNRSDLTLAQQALYITNCGCTSYTKDNSEIQRLANDLSAGTTNQLFLLTTVGLPANIGSQWAPALQAISNLGIDSYALQGIIPDYLGTGQRPGFSLISYQSNASGKLAGPMDLRKRYSTSANVQKNETGALRGVLAKQQNAYYEPVDVAPFTLAELPDYPTANNFLASSYGAVINSTEPVPWPQMDTQEKRSAYSYLSMQLIILNLGDRSCAANCDVRFYYTGTDAPAIYRTSSPNSVPYPGDTEAGSNGFGSAAFIAVQQQLQLESIYLGEVLIFQDYTKSLQSSDSQNVASAFASRRRDHH